MRSLRRARWLAMAIALSTFAPNALADEAPAKKKKKSVEACATFDQKDRESGDGVDLSIASSCGAKLSCSIKWSLTCSPGTKREKKTWEGVAFELERGQTDGANASANRCDEDDGWEIGSITWSCDPI